MDKFKVFCSEHRWTVTLVAAGLVFAILFMTIGFWRTLLLVVLVGIAFLLGMLLDRNGTEGVRAFFSKLFSKGDQNP